MKTVDACLVLRRACALWRTGNLPRLLANFEDDVVFSVHARPNAPSVVGEGLGKALFAQRLETLLDEFVVEEFELQGVWRSGFWYHTRVRYLYRHHVSGLVIDGTMRHKWGLVGDKIAHFELFHDAARMRAFLDMAVACDA
jgi:ketosteroid isomerase-like protein